MTRIILFAATNIAVLIVFAIAMQLLGVDQMLADRGVGIGVNGLLVVSAFFGMTGSFVSLLASKWIAKTATRARTIERPGNDVEAWLLETVGRHARASGIGMPEVAIYDAPDPNAFATGARRDKALVAVSTGLMRNMNRDEVDAVLAHEVSHVANGDMVTLTLIQGVLNTFVFFLSRVVGGLVDSALRRDGDRDRGIGIGYFATVIASQIIFGLLASIVVMWFSRRREFRADAGAADLTGPHKMIAALERLKAAQQLPAQLPESMRAMGIRGGGRRGLLQVLLSSHPPLDERIEALRMRGR
jgi:heat shock protein HtpX